MTIANWLTFAKRTLGVALAGTFLAIIIWALLPWNIGFLTLLRPLLGLLELTVVVAFLSELLATVIRWNKALAITASAVAAIAVVYLYAANAFHVYVGSWGKELPVANLQRLLLLSAVAVAAVAIVRFAKGKKPGLLPGMILAILVLAFIPSAILPHWNGTWKEKTESFDKSLAANGVLATITPQSSGNQMRYAEIQGAQPQFAARPETPPQNEPAEVVVHFPENNFGEIVQLPHSFMAGYCFDSVAGHNGKAVPDWDYSIQFEKQNLSGNWVPDGPALGPYNEPEDSPFFNDRPITFRLMGHEPKGGIVFYREPSQGCG